MTGRPWLIVAGDFNLTGGMDQANAALALELTQSRPVEVVTHSIRLNSGQPLFFEVRLVPRPLGMHLLGEPWLDRAGRDHAKRIQAAGGRVVVNGGNCRVGDINWVHYVHAAYAPEPPRGLIRRAKHHLARRRFLRQERDIIHQARVVICNSQRTATDVIDRLGIAPERVRVVYYGSDPQRLGPISPDDRARGRAALGIGDRSAVFFLGGLGDARKGLDRLLAAWRIASRRRDGDAVLFVIGAGRDLPTWQAQTADLGDRVRFLGFRSDVPTLLAGADLLVHPARYEPYGLGVHEALARGIPVIVSHHAGVVERLPNEGEPFVWVDDDRPESLTERLLVWVCDRSAWQRRAEEVAPIFRDRSWATMTAEFLEAVERGND